MIVMRGELARASDPGEADMLQYHFHLETCDRMCNYVGTALNRLNFLMLNRLDVISKSVSVRDSLQANDPFFYVD
jgi:hypothetical protein